MIKIVKFTILIAGLWLITLFTFRVINNDKVAVIVTDWGQPEGFSESYYQGIAQRSRIGIASTSEGEKCTENFVGEFPYRSSMGSSQRMGLKNILIIMGCIVLMQLKISIQMS